MIILIFHDLILWLIISSNHENYDNLRSFCVSRVISGTAFRRCSKIIRLMVRLRKKVDFPDTGVDFKFTEHSVQFSKKYTI